MACSCSKIGNPMKKLNLTKVLTNGAMIAAGGGLGLVAAEKVGSMVVEKFPTADPRLVNAGKVVLGAILAGYGATSKALAPVATSFGIGMAASGGFGLLKDFNVISGIGAGTYTYFPTASGGTGVLGAGGYDTAAGGSVLGDYEKQAQYV